MLRCLHNNDAFEVYSAPLENTRLHHEPTEKAFPLQPAVRTNVTLPTTPRDVRTVCPIDIYVHGVTKDETKIEKKIGLTGEVVFTPYCARQPARQPASQP